MTDYWISNERYYCKDCGCWMDAKPSSIRKHEEGYRHKGNVERLLKKLKRDKILSAKEANKHSSEIAAIERAAKKQYIKDCANGLSSSYGEVTFNYNHNNTNNNNHHYRCKDKRLFLPSDNDIFYYLDKNGMSHGPYSSSKMCIWYHFGFFVGALRIRKREESQFIHLRDIENPFNYKEFEIKFERNNEFRKNILNSIDITNANTVPPGIDIPQKLKDEFYKLYPSQTKKNKNNKYNIKNEEQHEYYSNGMDYNNDSNGMSKKQQRKIFIRGHMRKYKMKCNCGDSDCHLKHNNNHLKEDNNNDEMEEYQHKKEDKKEDKKDIKSKKEKEEKKENKDEFGFGRWEQVTKAEFDKKHSNQHLFKQNNTKKRWWRDQINANLPINKRKKLMGIDKMASDEERDFDDDYGINEILKQKELFQDNNDYNNNNKDDYDKYNIHNQYKQSSAKIAISIGNKLNIKRDNDNDNDNDILLDEEDVMVRDAKLKLMKLRENERKKEEENKKIMMETLNEYVNNECDNEQNKTEKQGLFKKKKKKKNRQKGKIVTTMR